MGLVEDYLKVQDKMNDAITRAEAAEKRVAELEALLSRNEGRIKEIVDEKLMADLATSQATVDTLWQCLHEAAMPDGNKRMVIRSRDLERVCKMYGIEQTP